MLLISIHGLLVLEVWLFGRSVKGWASTTLECSSSVKLNGHDAYRWLWSTDAMWINLMALLDMLKCKQSMFRHCGVWCVLGLSIESNALTYTSCVCVAYTATTQPLAHRPKQIESIFVWFSIH